MRRSEVPRRSHDPRRNAPEVHRKIPAGAHKARSLRRGNAICRADAADDRSARSERRSKVACGRSRLVASRLHARKFGETVFDVATVLVAETVLVAADSEASGFE